jgi:biopolymer transport protein ExbB
MRLFNKYQCDRLVSAQQKRLRGRLQLTGSALAVAAMACLLSFPVALPAQSPTPAKEPVVAVRPSEPAVATANPASSEAAPTKAKHRQIPTTPLEIAEAIGLPLLIAFLGTSVIAVWFTIERLVVLRRGRVIPRPFVERFLQNLE